MSNSAEDIVLEDNISCKPFLKWVGGKSQLLPELVRRIPKQYNTYFEPFLGGGALFFYLQPRKAFLSDLNPELINAYKVVRDDVESLISELKNHRYEENYYYQIRNLDRSLEYQKLSDAKKASRLIFLNKTGFNGLYRVNSKGYFNVPFGRYTNPNFCNEKNLLACSESLKAAKLTTQGFEKIVDSVKAGDFVYLDPPYVPVSRTSNFTNYEKNGFSLDLQKQLQTTCHILNEIGAMFLLSNSATDIVHDLYSDFRIEKVFANRMVNSCAARRGAVPELLISNYQS